MQRFIKVGRAFINPELISSIMPTEQDGRMLLQLTTSGALPNGTFFIEPDAPGIWDLVGACLRDEDFDDLLGVFGLPARHAEPE